MKIGKTRVFNPNKKGSFEVECWFSDWECSIIIGALKYYLENKTLPKGTKTFVEKLRKSFGKALGTILKSEFGDLKGNIRLDKFEDLR